MGETLCCALCLHSHVLLTVILRLKDIFQQNGKHSGSWHVVRPQKTSATLPIIVAIIPIFTVRIEAQRAKAGRCSPDTKPDLTDSKFSIFSSKPHFRGRSIGCLGLPSQGSASLPCPGATTFLLLVWPSTGYLYFPSCSFSSVQ